MPDNNSNNNEEQKKHTGPRYGKYGWDMPDADKREEVPENWADSGRQETGSGQQDAGSWWSSNGDSGRRDNGPTRSSNPYGSGRNASEPSNGWNERGQNGDQNYRNYNDQQPYGASNGWQQPAGTRYARPVDSEGRYLGQNLAVWSCVLGIISLSMFGTLINIPFAIIAVILGIRHLHRYNRNMGRTAAKIGIITAVASIVLLIGSYTAIMHNTAFTNMIEEEITDGSAAEDIQNYLNEINGTDDVDEL